MSYGLPTQIIPLDEKQLTYWRKEIERADKLREEKLSSWDVKGNLERYTPQNVKMRDGDIDIGVDFSDVERKKAAIFYDTPSITVVADTDGDQRAALLHQELLNGLLSDRQMNARATALKAILGCELAIQPSPTKIGYSVAIGEGTDPLLGTPVPVPVHEEFFWSKISEKALLIPVDFRDTDYDKAPWLGYVFRMPASQARREYGLPADWTPPQSDAKQPYFTDEHMQSDDASNPTVTGSYIEYRAATVDESVIHPELIRCMVLLDGMDQPVKHQDAPWQTLGPDGRLTADSVHGYLVHPLAYRDLPDSAYVASDSTITGPLTKEINKYRRQVIVQRDSNRLILCVDAERIDPDATERLKAMDPLKNLGYAVVPVQPGALQGSVNSVMAQVPTLELGRETYAGQDRIQRDRDRVMGINDNQVGLQTTTRRTATENAIVQRNSEARFEQERLRVLSWWLSGVYKLSALVLRYGDSAAVDILGPQRGQMWAQARQAGVLGKFRFELHIDSGKYLDVEAERQSVVGLYNLTAKDPMTNRGAVLKKMAKTWGIDPAEWLVAPPEPRPEPPKLSLAIKGEDLNPLMPQFPFVIEILRQGGVKFTIDTVQLGQLQAQALASVGRSPKTGETANDPVEAIMGGTPAPTAGVGPEPGQRPPAAPQGPATPADRLNQHQLDLTGRLSGPGPI